MATDFMLMTAEQLANMPRDSYRYELVRGELIQISPAKRQHGRIGESFNVYFGYHILTRHLGEVYLAETGFLLSRNPDTVRAPDFTFIQTDRLSKISGDDVYINIPPDLCVEVMSPGDRLAEVKQKVDEWLDFGTRIVIVINPKIRVTSVYRSRTEIETLTVNDTLQLMDLVPGWSLKLAEIFGSC